jgi:hypothetical protein
MFVALRTPSRKWHPGGVRCALSSAFLSGLQAFGTATTIICVIREIRVLNDRRPATDYEYEFEFEHVPTDALTYRRTDVF